MCSYDRVNSKSYAELNVAIFFHSAKFSHSWSNIHSVGKPPKNLVSVPHWDSLSARVTNVRITPLLF